MGGNFYSTSTLNFQIANFQVIIGGHQLFHWESLSEYFDKLPKESKSLAKLTQSETITLSKQEIYVCRHATRSVVSGIALQRYTWLHNTALPLETHCKVEGLPFERSILFSQSTDGFLSPPQEGCSRTVSKLGFTSEVSIQDFFKKLIEWMVDTGLYWISEN